MAKKEEPLVVEAVVLETLPGRNFRVRIKSENWPEENREIKGFVSGKMRRFSIKILPGDTVKMEI
jgi:translation initiation factor IF-1